MIFGPVLLPQMKIVHRKKLFGRELSRDLGTCNVTILCHCDQKQLTIKFRQFTILFLLKPLSLSVTMMLIWRLLISGWHRMVWNSQDRYKYGSHNGKLFKKFAYEQKKKSFITSMSLCFSNYSFSMSLDGTDRWLIVSRK